MRSGGEAEGGDHRLSLSVPGVLPASFAGNLMADGGVVPPAFTDNGGLLADAFPENIDPASPDLPGSAQICGTLPDRSCDRHPDSTRLNASGPVSVSVHAHCPHGNAESLHDGSGRVPAVRSRGDTNPWQVRTRAGIRRGSRPHEVRTLVPEGWEGSPVHDAIRSVIGPMVIAPGRKTLAAWARMAATWRPSGAVDRANDNRLRLARAA